MIDNIEIPTAILGFRPCLAQIKHFRFTLPYCYFRLSVIVSIIWMHFFELVMVGNPKNSHQNFDAIYCKRYKYFRFGGRIAISSCRSLTQSFEALSLNLSWSNPRIAVGISMLSIIVSEIYNYFRFGWPYCYIRLSVVVANFGALSLNSSWSKTPGCRRSRKRTNLLFFYLNSWGLFFTPKLNTCA